MKKFVLTVALVVSAAASFACGNCGNNACGGCQKSCGPVCAPQCARPCNSCCPGHYYPGQQFCTQGGGFNLNLFGGCGSCGTCR